MAEFDLVLRRARRYPHSDIVDIGVEGGRIAAIEPRLSASASTELDAEQKLVSPPFVESHVHLDSAMTAGDPRWNESGTLFEGIQIWGERKQSLSLEEVKNRAIETLKQQAQQGVLWVRTHADVSEPTLTALQALLEVRDAVSDWTTVQVVAFPQDGIYSHENNLELLEEALKLGADAIGGIPHYELTREDGVKSIETIFKLAEQFDRLIDVHCDEIDDEQSRFLEVMAACNIRSGMGARVTASHTTAMGSYNNAYTQKLMGFLQRAQLNFIANPLINITLQGRTDTYPKRRGITRVKELWQRGLNVSFGHDCICDPWYSLGTGNMLDVAWMGLHVCQMTGKADIEACYEMVTHNGAKTLNVEADYGLEVGKPASFVVLDSIDPFDTLRRRAIATIVVSRGNVLSTSEIITKKWI
ncbi:MAG: cytosine deaminase [Cyanobacteria bacterium SBC]|nr:cytosine deaminase [Cyanobacteria bacterium SBC]